MLTLFFCVENKTYVCYNEIGDIMSDNYEDIINLEHPEPIHPRMSRESRAAQFAPFAALTGYDEEVKEVGRETNKEIYITEDIKETLDQKLAIIINNIKDKPTITITYFIKDSKKSGGEYNTKTIKVKSIDMIYNHLITTNKEIINIDDIIDIEGDIFDELYS